MKILDILVREAIVPEMRAASKAEALDELAAALVALHPDIDPGRLVEVLRDREELGSTAIGEGIAIPHGKLGGVRDVLAVFGRSPNGIDFESLDGKPTWLFFLLVAPEDSAGVHLKALARVSRLLKDDEFRQRLLKGGTADELFEIIGREDGKY